MTAAQPSWDLSRTVRTTIVCRNQKVNGDTATTALIDEVAAGLIGRGDFGGLAGYDAGVVRAILLDTSVRAPYPAEAPAKYAGK